ncbi:hypothetical protein IMG5_093800, partial [Ichthyophthirius multifiliis]
LQISQDDNIQNLNIILSKQQTNIYIPFDQQTRVHKEGFTSEQYSQFQYFGATLIEQACKMLQLPIQTCHTAQILFHRYYYCQSFLYTKLIDIIPGCVFLSCKIQETLKTACEISHVFSEIFKKEQIFENFKNQKSLEQLIIQSEFNILKVLGFEVHYFNENNPHRLMYSYINLFKNNQQINNNNFQELSRCAFYFLNDSFKSNICLYLPIQNIIAACIYSAFRLLNLQMPKIAWWTILECSYDNMLLGSGKIFFIFNQIKKGNKVLFNDLQFLIDQKLRKIQKQKNRRSGSSDFQKNHEIKQNNFKYHNFQDKQQEYSHKSSISYKNFEKHEKQYEKNGKYYEKKNQYYQKTDKSTNDKYSNSRYKNHYHKHKYQDKSTGYSSKSRSRSSSRDIKDRNISKRNSQENKKYPNHHYHIQDYYEKQKFEKKINK